MDQEATEPTITTNAVVGVVEEGEVVTTASDELNSTTTSNQQSHTINNNTTSKDGNTVITCTIEGMGPSKFLQRASASQDNNKIYIYGGENSNGFWTNTLSIIDDQGEHKQISWKKPKCFDFPPKVDGHSQIVSNNGSLVLFGGASDDRNNSVYWLDLETLEWSINLYEDDENSNANQIPQGRRLHSTAMVGDNQMYIFGGVSSKVGSDTVLNDVFVYNLDNTVWSKVNISGESPAPRSGHSMVYNAKSESLIVFGGKATTYTNEVWSLSLSTLSWTLIDTTGNVPPGRENHTSVVCNKSDKMIVYGGWTIGGPKNDLYSLDLTTFEWKRYTHNCESDQNSKRFGHASVCIDGVVQIFGGKNHLFNNQTDILKFNLNDLVEQPISQEQPKKIREIEEIILDLDEKKLSAELFKKPNFDPKDVTFYKNIFDQLTEENIQQYQELNKMLLKQKLFSAQVEKLIETNKTLMAKEFTTPLPPPPSYSEPNVPYIYSEEVETPQSFKDLIGEVFTTSSKQSLKDSSSILSTTEESNPKVLVDDENPQKGAPKINESLVDQSSSLNVEEIVVVVDNNEQLSTSNNQLIEQCVEVGDRKDGDVATEIAQDDGPTVSSSDTKASEEVAETIGN